jgi:hypothetical protein
MNSSRKSGIIFAAFVAICLLFFAYWMVSGLFGLDGKYLTGSDSGDNENSAGFASSQSSLGNDSVKFSYIDKNGNVSVSSADDVNFTELVATDISSEFVSKSKLSPQSKPSEVVGKMNPSGLVQNKLSEILNSSAVDFVDSVPDSQLKIIQDNSKEKVQRYGTEYAAQISKLGGILNGDDSYLNRIMDNAMRNSDYSELNQALANNAAVLKSLISTEVPSSVLTYHKQSIMFLKNLSVFLGSIKTISTDPLKAYLMMEKGLSLLTGQAASVTQSYQLIKTRYNL